MAYDEVLLVTLLRRTAGVNTDGFVHVREMFIVEIDEFGFQFLYEVISFTPAVVAGVDKRFLCESVPTRLAFKVSFLTWGG